MRKKRIISVGIIFIINLFIISQIIAKEVKGKSGMVVSAHPIASEFGVEILKSGGNAVDAAVGSALVLGVVEPHASGLGGGGGMLIYLQEKDSLTYINYYAQAPRLVATDFSSSKESHEATSVLVPGTVIGLHYALNKFGSIPWGDLLNKVIAKVENGFEIDPTLHKVILDSYDTLMRYPQTASIYLDEGLPPEMGAKIKNDRIIWTLKKLAEEGPDVFYQGEIADSIEAVVFRNGGGLRKSDLMNYEVQELKPVAGTYREHSLYSAPSPQSGISLIEILNILEFKNLSKMKDYTKNPSTFHFMIEAIKRGFIDRYQYLGDMRFYDVPTQILLSKDYAASRLKTIEMDKVIEASAGDVSAFLKMNPVEKENPDGSTSHISVVDSKGNAVSLTQTLNYFWGSGLSVCGFMLNNGMTSFSSNGDINTIQSHQQPRSTISPTIILKDGKLYMVVGTPGGGRIISTMAEVVCNVIDFGKGVEEANNAPRFSLKRSNTVTVEDQYSEDLINHLKSMGHKIDILGKMDMYFGGVQMILVDSKNGILHGSSDPRRAGAAVGF